MTKGGNRLSGHNLVSHARRQAPQTPEMRERAALAAVVALPMRSWDRARFLCFDPADVGDVGRFARDAEDDQEPVK